MTGREGRGPERPGPDYPSEWDLEPEDVEEERDRRPYMERMALDTTPGAEEDDEGRITYSTSTPDPWQVQGPVPPPPF